MTFAMMQTSVTRWVLRGTTRVQYDTEAGRRKTVIRNAVVSRAARLSRALVRSPLLEVPFEYALYLAGWVAWVLDWVVRGPALWRAENAPAPGLIAARAVVLMPPGADPSGALARARAVCRQSAALLGRHGIALSLESAAVHRLPAGLRLPRCGVGDLLARFFSWASARAAPSPTLTIYFAEELGNLAGCSIPGADWIIVALGTDGTTVVHEIGHLADLWRHHPDPANVMTDRPGGTHDGITPTQLGMIRTCRFVRPASTPVPLPRGADRDRDGDRIADGAERGVDSGTEAQCNAVALGAVARQGERRFE